MFADDSRNAIVERGYPGNFRGGGRDSLDMVSGFMPHHVNVIRANYSPTHSREVEVLQRSADSKLGDLMIALVMASPEMRRHFMLLLDQLTSLDALCPLSMDNPFRYKLRDIENYIRESKADHSAD